MVITIINVVVKDTHAYYNSVTAPVQIFNGKVGNFKPRIDSFYIKQATYPKYTNSNINTVYITPGNNNSNLDQMCVTETNDVNSCYWVPLYNTYDYSFVNQIEGSKYIYGFIKDRYGNKSAVSVDTITYDITPPTVTYSVPSGIYNANQIVTVTPSDTVSGVGLWASTVYRGGALDYSNPDYSQSSWDRTGQISSSTTITEGIWTIYSVAYDNAGNIHNQQPVNPDNWYYQTYTIDTTPPTVWYSLTEGEYTGGQTITIVPSDNLSGVGFWAVHVYKDGIKIEEQSGNNLTGQPNFTVNLTEGSTWTVYTQVYDNAGNIIAQQPNNGSGWVYQTYTIKKSGKSGQDLINERESNSALKNTPLGGLYRYYGSYQQVTNNYICFGTNNKTECLNSPDKYMYRIIGITDGSEGNTNVGLKEGQLKLIKAIPLTDNQQWHHDRENKTPWDSSDLFNYLNNNFLTDAKTNQWQNGDYWDSLITSQGWYISIHMVRGESITVENTGDVSKSAKIGLLYVSDYVDAYGVYHANWLQASHGWSTNDYYSREWTMTWQGKPGAYYFAFNIWNDSTGAEIGASDTTLTLPVRPAFYLSTTVSLTGEGLDTDPFIIQ